jgi:hypothetical protein
MRSTRTGRISPGQGPPHAAGGCFGDHQGAAHRAALRLQAETEVGIDASLDWFTVARDGRDFVSGECLGTVLSGAERRGVRSGRVLVEVEVVAFEVSGAAHPFGSVLGVGGDVAEDLAVVVGRVLGDLADACL